MAGAASQPSEGSDSFSERDRIDSALVDLVLEQGYEAATVEAVCERASVSAATFERHFADLQDCFIQVHTRNNDLFDERVQAAFVSYESWRDALRATAYAAADFFSEHPREVRFNVIVAFSAGDMIAAKRDAYLQQVVDFVDAGRYELDDPDSIGRSVAESTIGSIFERLVRDVQRGGDGARARDFVPELMYVAVRPYLGHAIAREELSIPPPAPLGQATRPKAQKQRRTQSGTPVQRGPAHRYLPRVPKRELPADDRAPGLARLPPGRHGLSREFVTQNQRDRLVAGIIAAVAERGYHEATISQIAAAAGVSRRTFYTYFSSKEECFFDAYQVIGAHLAEAARVAATPHEEWPEQVRAQLAAALEFFAANPDLARFYMIAPPRAGEEIAARYRLASSRVLTDLTEGMPVDMPAPTQAVQNALGGGMAALIAGKVEAGEGEALPDLLPDLVELFLTPFLGREEAVRVARSGS